MHSPFSLELETVDDFGSLLAEVPEVEAVIGGGGDQGALVCQEHDLHDCRVRLVPYVRVHARPAQSVTAESRNTTHLQTAYIDKHQYLFTLKHCMIIKIRIILL